MKLPTLRSGRILRRYQRFLADVELEDGRQVTAHCPNTGSMKSCWEPGAPAQVSFHDNPRRKLHWTLERVDMGAGWIGVHTGRVNAVVAEGIAQGRIAELSGYARIRREAPVQHAGDGPRGRLDLLLTQGARPDAYVEVKNVTLLQGERLCFPDAVTLRGRKHLDLLLDLHRRGFRAVMLFALNRPEGVCFAPAGEVDPNYARRLREVASEGVEVMAVRLEHSEGSVAVGESVSVDLGGGAQ